MESSGMGQLLWSLALCYQIWSSAWLIPLVFFEQLPDGLLSIPTSATCDRQSLPAQSLNHVCLFMTPWTVACWAPLSMGIFRQEYWSGLSFPSPGDQTCISCVSSALQMDSLPTEPSGKTLGWSNNLHYLVFTLLNIFPFECGQNLWFASNK